MQSPLKEYEQSFVICFLMKTWDRFFDETLTNRTVEFTIICKNKNKQTNKNKKINQNKKERKENQIGNFDLHHKNFAFFLKHFYELLEMQSPPNDCEQIFSKSTELNKINKL